jgi:hypothetical protein
MRPEELKYLKGDSTKIRETLGWKPEYTFETLMDDMVDSWDEIIVNELNNMIKKTTNSVSKTGTTKTTKDKKNDNNLQVKPKGVVDLKKYVSYA